MSPELIKDTLRMSGVKERPQLQVLVEEDILVPDVKPDLAKIIASDCKVKITEKENYAGSLRVGGDLLLNLIYVPEEGHMNEEGAFPMATMEAKIAFKHDGDYACQNMGNIEIKWVVEHIDFTVINERKFRVNAVVVFNVKEYEDISHEMLGSGGTDQLQVLKKPIVFTDMSGRKKEYMDIKEDLPLKESDPEIGKILKYDMSVIETYRQITNEKAVVSGNLFYHILYMSDEIESKPVFFQTKTEFTQFIKLDGTEDLANHLAGSKIDFMVDSLKIEAKKDENDNLSMFEVSADISTTLEMYRNRSYDIVVDAYHSQKDIALETEELTFACYVGQGATEATIRETLTIPGGYENIGEVVSISGKIFETAHTIEKERNIVEGVVSVEVLYLPDDDRKGIYGFTEEIPFRNFVEISGIEKDMQVEDEFIIKDVWFDRLNDRQLEINIGLALKSNVMRNDSYQVVKDAILKDPESTSKDQHKIILYVSRDGDSLWNIAKKYKTTPEAIMQSNQMEEEQELYIGRKLLIW